MFMLDVETAAKTTEAVLLSVGIVHFDPAEKPSIQKLRENSIFVKFNATDQIARFKRKTQKSTLDWWKEQSKEAKIASLIPNPELDLTLEEGFDELRSFVKKYPKFYLDYCWVRGFLDSMIMDSIEEQLQIKPIFNYGKYRDVRTALDFMYGSTNGYPEMEYPYGTDELSSLVAHNPVDDDIRDCLLMMYGKSNDKSE